MFQKIYHKHKKCRHDWKPLHNGKRKQCKLCGKIKTPKRQGDKYAY